MKNWTLKVSLLLIFCVACTTHPHPKGHDEYVKTIRKYSAGDKQFAGVYHNFEFRSTPLSRDISKKIHNRMMQFYDWDEQEASEKLQTRMSELDDKTKIWLSFFTPDSKNDNLANKVSIWKVYLHAGGTRYEGKAKKANMNYSEAQALFPYHNRWTTPYYIEFPVPTDELQGQSAKLIITGPLGRREVRFPKPL